MVGRIGDVPPTPPGAGRPGDARAPITAALVRTALDVQTLRRDWITGQVISVDPQKNFITLRSGAVETVIRLAGLQVGVGDLLSFRMSQVGSVLVRPENGVERLPVALPGGSGVAPGPDMLRSVHVQLPPHPAALAGAPERVMPQSLAGGAAVVDLNRQLAATMPHLGSTGFAYAMALLPVMLETGKLRSLLNEDAKGRLRSRYFDLLGRALVPGTARVGDDYAWTFWRSVWMADGAPQEAEWYGRSERREDGSEAQHTFVQIMTTAYGQIQVSLIRLAGDVCDVELISERMIEMAIVDELHQQAAQVCHSLGLSLEFAYLYGAGHLKDPATFA